MGIGQATGRTRVLVVEDDAAGRTALRLLLSDTGYEVDEAADSRLALERLAHSVPDLVLLDRRLPDMDGLTICRAIKAEYPTLPVLMLTAADSPEERLAGFAAGADDYIAKPYNSDELLARLAVFDRLRRAELAAQQRAAEMSTLLALTHVLMAETDPVQVLRRAAEVAQQLVLAEGASVALVEPEQWRLVALHTTEGWQPLALTADHTTGLHGWVASNRQPGRAGADELDPLIHQALAGLLEARAALIVPLVSRDGTVRALLALYNRRGGAAFSDDDERLAVAVATQATLALENARLLAAQV